MVLYFIGFRLVMHAAIIYAIVFLRYLQNIFNESLSKMYNNY